MNRFEAALAAKEQTVPPIWFMRQAGRYQRAYQQFRRRYTFDTLCREPELAARVALSSVEDFDFDAAILFSDLLFPLEALGLGLKYDDSGPKISGRLTTSTVGRLRPVEHAIKALSFQAEAVAATRRLLPTDKGLIGFIGGPWTLFVYATEGTHKGSLGHAKSSFDIYRRFSRVMTPLLERMARAQLGAGADIVMVFDTAAGELTPADFKRLIAPDLTRLATKLPNRIGYYARGAHPAHFDDGVACTKAPWAGHGFDWRWDLSRVLATPGRQGFVQGNFDPALLRLTGRPLGRAIDDFLEPILALPAASRRGWICGLGHGVLPDTPEASVRSFVKTVRKRLA